MKCPLCGINMYNVGLPGEEDHYICLEGCQNLLETLPVADLKEFESSLETSTNEIEKT